MGDFFSERLHIRANSLKVSRPVFIVCLPRLLIGVFLVVFRLHGYLPRPGANAGLLRAFGSFEYAAPGH